MNYISYTWFAMISVDLCVLSFPVAKVTVCQTAYSVSLNLLLPRDAFWQHITGLILMACCLIVPSHYLKQCELITSKVKSQSPAHNFMRHILAINYKNLALSSFALKSPRSQWVKLNLCCFSYDSSSYWIHVRYIHTLNFQVPINYTRMAWVKLDLDY